MRSQFAFLALLPLLSWGQPGFNVVYNHTVANGWPDPGGGAGKGVWVLDTGYVVFSHQVATNGFTKVFTHRFDTSGQCTGYTEFYANLQQNHNYGYTAVADTRELNAISGICEFDDPGDSTNRVKLMTFNPAGDTLATHVVYDSCFCGPLQTRRWGEDKVLMAGFIGVGGALFATDTAGQLLWEQAYPDTRLAYSAADLSDNTLLLAGQRASGIDNTIWVMRLDSTGSTIWRRNIGGSSFAGTNVDALQTSDGGIVATCSYMPIGSNWSDPQWNYFRKWDINGNVVWTKQYNEQPRTTAFDLEELPNGDLVACGAESQTAIANHGLLFRLASDGDLVWLRRYAYYTNTSAIHTPYDVEPTADGGFVMAGRAIQGSPDSLPGLQMVWLLKVDSMGCLVPGCGNIGVAEMALGLEHALRAYPNPASGTLNVEAALPPDLVVRGHLQLVLVDALGRTVREQVLGKQFTRTTLAVADLPPGLYHLHLRDEGRWLSGTAVVVV